MRRFFGVDGLDPDTEINHSIGSKPALAMLPLAFVNPGDVVLSTVPGYPGAGHPHAVPRRRGRQGAAAQSNGFFPDLAAIDARVANRAKLFYVNYPNNPTGRGAHRRRSSTS